MPEIEAIGGAGEAGPEAHPVAVPPLRVAGLVVRKADLVEVLRAYVPGLVDLLVTEDGEHFWLVLAEGTFGGGIDADPRAR